MNPNHPVYARIIELVQKAEIDSFRALAGALGVSLESAMNCVSRLEDRGCITRTQNGVFIALGQEPKSGLFLKPLPPLSKEQRAEITRQSVIKMHAENRVLNPPKAPCRLRRPAFVLDSVIEQSETLLRDAPPDDPELGRMIIESKAPTAVQQQIAKRSAERAAGQARLEALTRRIAERAEAKRSAREAAKVERAKAAEARRAGREVLKAIARRELEQRRIERGIKTGRCKFCPHCMDLGERRPVKGPCPGCGEYFEKEAIERFSQTGFSALATFDAH